MNKERFLVPAHGPDPTAVAIGVDALKVLCEKHKTNSIVLVPALKHAADTVLNQVLSERHVQELARGKTLKLSEQHGVSMCSQATLKNHTSAPVVLALFASAGMIERAEKAWGCKALIVVPWIAADSEQWVTSYAPMILSIPAKGSSSGPPDAAR